jgi:hypothetical protein
LLQQVCSPLLPADERVVQLQPLVSRCELGLISAGHFELLQLVEIMDQRRFRIKSRKVAFACSQDSLQAFRARWQNTGLFSEACLDMAPRVAIGHLSFEAGWKKVHDVFQFETQGQLSLRTSGFLLDCHAGLMHQGQWVGLRIQSIKEVMPEWRFHSCWAQGSLPVGAPFVVCRQPVPITLELQPVIRLGQPVLNAAQRTAGELVLTLQGQIEPASRRLELELVLSHSALVCHWQTCDVIRGVDQGCWNLLEESVITRWSLLDG